MSTTTLLDGCVRGYDVHTQSKAREEPGPVEEVTIGFYNPEGGTPGEFEIRWENFDGEIVPRLCAFGDSWRALAHCCDLLEGLAAMDHEAPHRSG